MRFKQMFSRNIASKPMTLDSIYIKKLKVITMLSIACTTAEQNIPWYSDSEIKIEKDSTVTINGRKTSDFWDSTIHTDTKPLSMKIRNICDDETIITLKEQ